MLCGYLRLPYDPTNPLLSTIVEETTSPPDDNGDIRKRSLTYEQLPNDREVRLTIISTISGHLREDAAVSWQGRDFDFTGATFDGGDFSGAIFSGGQVDFGDANFSGGYINFFRATFSGGQVVFSDATFSGGQVDFTYATFSAGQVVFIDATFSGGQVDFIGATFSGRQVSFRSATFSGGQVNFFSESRRNQIARDTVNFDAADFTPGVVTMDGKEFHGWPATDPSPDPAPDDPDPG